MSRSESKRAFAVDTCGATDFLASSDAAQFSASQWRGWVELDDDDHDDDDDDDDDDDGKVA